MQDPGINSEGCEYFMNLYRYHNLIGIIVASLIESSLAIGRERSNEIHSYFIQEGGNHARIH
jgi:hypothetical protein